MSAAPSKMTRNSSQSFCWSTVSALPSWRNRSRYQLFDAVRGERRQQPGHACTPVMTHHVCPFHAQRIHDARHVLDRLTEPVALDLRWALRPAPATQVGHDDAKTRGGQRRDLVAPQFAGVREAVKQYHCVPRALVPYVEVEPVRPQSPRHVEHI